MGSLLFAQPQVVRRGLSMSLPKDNGEAFLRETEALHHLKALEEIERNSEFLGGIHNQLESMTPLTSSPVKIL